MKSLPNLPWYLPSFHGDIKLERTGPETTTVRAYELTPTEEKAMAVLRARALKEGPFGGAPWATEKDFVAIEGHSAYRSKDGVTITLAAPIAKVQAILAKEMKPGRKLVDAYLFSDGRMEEVRRTEAKTSEPPEPIVPPPDAEQPKAAATVAAPTIGCPVPEFPESELRATRVLEAFLTPEQLRDYRAHGVVMAKGVDTGHQYAITHRGRKANMRHVSFRSLFDMTDKAPLCVHDWTVPPPEEMLALLLCVSLPGRERYVRSLPEVYV